MTDFAPRSLLYVPGSNARALEKAQALAADMLIIDLEDAVPADRKDDARAAMRAAVTAGYPGKRVAVRINGAGTAHQAADIDALAGLPLDAVVLPKVDAIADLAPARGLGLPLLAMIETPAAIYAARDIAADPGVAGLIAGLNDLAHELKLPDGTDRDAMSHAIQAIVLAARAGGVWCFDGVYNAIDDVAGFAAEAAEGRRLGFDGKTLIHPSQVDPCNAAFAPTVREIAAAEALVAAATGGAQRHEGRMIEDMHVAAARALLARARG
ncbi:HpcH/HpaI aldolase/citrate lyase family protein [Sphingopyxis alaskensis]|jgi:citrate lyase subunit beta/citryl-CoA lyase|uniref:HpcH/HpaI aldolase n=1 Tax=Sphingopyxis alaskensis (strain DSM 13593 / LMG 18877 / RB2256) TaxID=317655 RepID=Q1GQZ9_SPHAL|nr:CoA ester lyase [Sphingopyxis alaskensis]ABF53923.1 HpcH/HpaI aldolase [Sphingopyxis alaskensis RB2256]MCM3420730.1 CoA ester lyase [Sphingopyxis alaskensis]